MKTPMNNELANSNHCSQRDTGLAACETLEKNDNFGHLILFGVFLLKVILFYMHVQFISMDLAPNSTVTRAWAKLSWHTYVLQKAHLSLPTLRSTGQQFNTAFGTIITGQSPTKSTKCESVAPNRPLEAPYLWYESWDREAEGCLFQPQPGMCVGDDSNFPPILYMSVVTTKAPQVLIRGLQITFIG